MSVTVKWVQTADCTGIRTSVQIRAACCRSVSFSSSVHERKPPDLSGGVAFQISWSSWGMETIRTLPFSSPSTVTRCLLSAPKKDLSFHKKQRFPREHSEESCCESSLWYWNESRAVSLRTSAFSCVTQASFHVTAPASTACCSISRALILVSAAM